MNETIFIVFAGRNYEGSWPIGYFRNEENAKAKVAEVERLIEEGKTFDYDKFYAELPDDSDEEYPDEYDYDFVEYSKTNMDD